MPLVVPGINSKGSNAGTDWTNLLVGKKLSDGPSDHSSFSKTQLPPNHRVVQGDTMLTMDHNPDRLNVHVGKDGTINKVKFG